MALTRSIERLALNVDELARFLDLAWSGWRDGFPETDSILFRPVANSSIYIVSLGEKVGTLDIDGTLYYSDAWL